MARLLFVVHRYVPFPGGSEYFVRDMAEESLRRGHAVTVLTHWHRGDRSGLASLRARGTNGRARRPLGIVAKARTPGASW